MRTLEQMLAARWLNKGYVEYEQAVTQADFDRAFVRDVESIVRDYLAYVEVTGE